MAPAFAGLVKVGRYPAKIVPEQVCSLGFSGKGTVTDLVDPSGRIPAGTVIGILNKDLTATEFEDMELALERELLGKQDEIRKLEEQRRKVGFYLTLSPEERRYAQLDESGVDVTEATLQDIDARINLLRREMATLERRRRHDFDVKHADLTLRMPFDGRLQYSIALPEDLSTPVEYHGGASYQGFATACDDSAFYITIVISNAALTQLPEENFSVVVSLPDRRELRGTFARRKVERSNGGSDILVYFFRVPVEDHETAFSMLGSNATATLYFEAGEGVETVSKAELLADPRASQCDDWEQLVETVYPGYGIIIIAEREIVIRKH